MKLQTNTAGSWRDVLQFDAARVEEVKAATVPLADLAGADTKWRLLLDDNKPLFLRGQRWLSLKQIQARGGC